MTVSPQPGNQDERRCVCGDTLGQHDVDGDRQCLAGDPDNPWECDCSEFRAAAAAGQTGAGEEADDSPFGRTLAAAQKAASASPEQIAALGETAREVSDRAGASKPPWAIGRVFPCTVTDELALPGGDVDSTPPAPSAGQDTDCAGCRHPKGLHVWEYEDCCSGPGPTKYGCGCPAFTTTPPPTLDEIRASLRPAPSAGQNTGQMRDERSLERQIADVVTKRIPDIEIGDLLVLRADLLDGPLRQLIAERDEARQSARQAWDVHSEHVDRMNVLLLQAQAVRDDLRRELDQARGQVQRVEAAASELERPVNGLTGPDGPMTPLYDGRDVAFRIRRALDPT